MNPETETIYRALLTRALVCIEDPRVANEWGSDERVELAAAIREALKPERQGE